MTKLLIMDVDGTLTDGKIYMGNDGEICKAFNIKDGCGIHDLLPQYGIIPVIITGRNSKIVENRCCELGISEIYQGTSNKLSRLERLLEKKSLTYADCAYVGDDIIDVPCMKKVKKMGGLVGCPADAVDSVKKIADYISAYNGGNGAVRDFIEYLVKIDNT